MRSNPSSAYQNLRHPLLCNEKSLVSGALHYFGMCLAIGGVAFLLRRAIGAAVFDSSQLFAFAVYGLSMVLLYAASGTYHTFFISRKVHRLLRKLDHCMIYLLVAGSYTPICVVALSGATIGKVLLVAVWATALLGIIMKLFWVEAPRWMTAASYIAMGWAALFAIIPLYQRLPRPGFVLLLTGGVAYTVGGVCYGLKVPRFHGKWFGAHEFFHVLILIGSIAHYVMICFFIA